MKMIDRLYNMWVDREYLSRTPPLVINRHKTMKTEEAAPSFANTEDFYLALQEENQELKDEVEKLNEENDDLQNQIDSLNEKREP